MFACTSSRTPPVGALACAPGSGTLPPFAALTALVVRRVSGYGDLPSLACAVRRATPKGVERVPGGGTLPPFAVLTALVVRRVRVMQTNQCFAKVSRRATPEGVERAPGSGTLPPARAIPKGMVHCLKLRRKTCKIGTL